MKEIDENILRYCGIYQKPEVSEKKKREILKKKRELEKETGMKIEKIYVYGESYWGKNANENTIGKEVCFLTDERIQRIDEVFQPIELKKQKIKVLFWSLCQFEKRKQFTGELDYYISRYGKLILDTKKEVEIDEKIYTTEYAVANNYFKDTKKYVHTNENDILMKKTIEIYLLKIGYHLEIGKMTIEELIEYANYVSEEEKVKQILLSYIQEKDEEKRNKIYMDFEEYVKHIRQETISFKLPKQPTMKIFEKKEEQFEKEGILDIKSLTREELYIMYVIQEKGVEEIAKLYGVENRKITEKNNNWHNRVKEEITNPNNMREIIRKMDKGNKTLAYIVLRKSGLLSFEECISPILKFMKTGEVYLLKEFWRFTEFKKEDMEKEFTGANSKTWYRATLAMEFLKDNELVEEVDFKKYRITKKGREMVKDAQSLFEEKIDFKFLLDMLGRVNLFGMVDEREDLNGIEKREKKLISKLPVESKNIKTEKLDIAKEIKQEEKQIKIVEDMINELELTDRITGNCQIKQYQRIRNRNGKIKPTVKRETSNKNRIEISDEMKSNLGIKGEKYLYQCLQSKKKELLEALGIEDYQSIIFYNINYDEVEEDKSIGHGCDIEVILQTGEHLYLEIKTSLENTEYYTMTYNEYQCNIEKQDKYFIIKINNFKYLNKDESKVVVNIIRNPHRILMKNTNILKNITFYTKY